jgi:predicted small integral membrane protein
MDVLIGVWVVALVIQVVALLTFTTPSQHKQQVFRLGSHITNVPFSADARGFLYWGLLVSTLIAVVFAVAGLVHMLRGRRLQALTQIERALLVSIFLIQVFAFVHSQFTAVLGLFIDLALFFAVRSMLGQELERQP